MVSRDIMGRFIRLLFIALMVQVGIFRVNADGFGQDTDWDEEGIEEALGKDVGRQALDDRDAKRRECLANVKDEYRQVVGAHIKGKQAILVDMVAHWNLGDSYIQVGEHILMEELGTPPSIPCALFSGPMHCNFSKIREAIKNDPRESVIIIEGGGNFGDLFVRHRHFQNMITEHFRDVPIVFLPQSIFYKNPENAATDSRIRSQHPNVHYFARDLPSLDFLRKNFNNQPSTLAPDGAQMIGPIDVQCKPKYDVFFLTRINSDPEKVWTLGDVDKEALALTEKGNLTYKISDWSNYKEFVKQYGLVVPSDPLLHPKYRTMLGIKVLCQGKMIVTDRLHAVMLATLMGLPYVYLECSYGKTNNYREAIYQPRPECHDNNLRAHKANSWGEAVQLVLDNFEKDSVYRQ